MKKFFVFFLFFLIWGVSCETPEVYYNAPPLEYPDWFDGKVVLKWANVYKDSVDFEGYNVYVSTDPAIKTATGDAPVLNEALVKEKVKGDEDTIVVEINTLKDNTPLSELDSFYVQVRAVTTSGVGDDAGTTYIVYPCPTGTGEIYTYKKETTTHSGFGWNRETGEGSDYSTQETNKDSIDFFATLEEQTGTVILISPKNADFITWEGKLTYFTKLERWYTPDAPEINEESVTIIPGDVVGIKTEDGYYAKIEVQNIEDVEVQGYSLKKIEFRYAFQTKQDYPHF